MTAGLGMVRPRVKFLFEPRVKLLFEPVVQKDFDAQARGRV